MVTLTAALSLFQDKAGIRYKHEDPEFPLVFLL